VQTHVNDTFSRSCLSPDVELLSLHVLESSLMEHNANHALNITQRKARFPSKRNRVRCVWICKQQPIGCSVEAVATMIGCLPTQALAFSPVSIQTQRTQRKQSKRLRLDGNRVLHFGCCRLQLMMVNS